MRNQNIPIQEHLDRMMTAVTEISNHNKSFGGGAYLGGAMADLVLNHISLNPGERRHSDSHQCSADSSIQDLFNTHKTLLNQNGFGLMTRQDNSLAIYLDSIEAAVNFISAIPRNAFPNSLAQELAKTIKPIFISLAEQEPFEDISKASVDIKYLCELLASRGAGKEIEPSYILLRALNGGFLNEQIKVDHSKILEKTSVGPSEWHLDSSPNNLYKKWSEAIKITQEINTNPKASDLSERMIKVLGVGLESFQKTIDQWSTGQKAFPYKIQKLSQYEAVARLIRYDFDELMSQN
jgi:hypothetical protein